MIENWQFYALGGLITLLVYWVLVPRNRRSLVLLVASVVFIASFDTGYSIFFVISAWLVYTLANTMRRDGPKKVRILQLSLVWLIGGLCLFKYTRKLTSLLPEIYVPSVVEYLILPLGLSYITFRMIHYVMEVYRGKIPPHSFTDFAAYVLFLPTYISGPVERFPAFQKQTAAEKTFDLADINYGLYRIGCGIVKKFSGDWLLAEPVMEVLRAPTEATPLAIVLAIYGLSIKIYLDFSGYTDIALGVARFFGYTIMENFNYPYFQSSIAGLWRRWHISVYSFIRDYFFLPFFARRPSILKTTIGLYCTMLLFTLWHDLTWNWFALGLYHGTGLAVWSWTQELKWKFPAVRKFFDAKALTPFFIFLTFSFFSFSILFFDFDPSEIRVIVSEILSF